MTFIVPLNAGSDRPVPFIDLVPQFQSMSAEVMAVVERVFAEQKFIGGDEVVGLEEEIATYCDSRFAVGCNSGTDALIIALQALDIGEGDEVITGIVGQVQTKQQNGQNNFKGRGGFF